MAVIRCLSGINGGLCQKGTCVAAALEHRGLGACLAKPNSNFCEYEHTDTVAAHCPFRQLAWRLLELLVLWQICVIQHALYSQNIQS